MSEKLVVNLSPNEKFSIEVFRTDGGLDGFVEKLGVSKGTVKHWINNVTEPSKIKRAKIEKMLPSMKVDFWKMTHKEELECGELLYIYSIRKNLSNEEISEKLHISRFTVSRILSGFKDYDDAVKQKIITLTKQIWSASNVEG